MRIYIAGPITNNPNYKEDFKRAEDFIRSTGHEPWNPVKPEGSSYKFYIDCGLHELSRCDAIYLINGWAISHGAKLEANYAEAVGFPLLFESDPNVKNYLLRLKNATKNKNAR